jgi:methyl-accepting chemotaxis protein
VAKRKGFARRIIGAFTDLGLRTQILCCATIPLIVIVTVAILGLRGLEEVYSGSQMLDRSHETVQGLLGVEAHARAAQSGLRGFALTGDEKFRQQYEEATGRVQKSLEELKKKLGQSSDQGKSLAEAQEQFRSWGKMVAQPILETRQKSGAKEDLGSIAKMTAKTESAPYFDRFLELIGQESQSAGSRLAGERAKIDASNHRTTRLVSWGVPVVIALTFIIFYLLSGMITRPFRQAQVFFQAVVDGNLTGRMEVRSDNEVGRLGSALNQMVEWLKNQADQVLEGIGVLTASASEIATAGAQLAASTSRSSSAVTETTTTVEQVRQAAQVAGEQAKTVAKNSRHAVEISNSGRQATEDTVRGINQIKEQMESIADTVLKLNEQSEAIEEIIAAVKDLADQSNLLAVNASIEAARAGDHGKGFAVVAQEIKTLADQSKDATEQVRSMLDDTRKWVRAVVMATEQGGKAVDAGVRQSVLAGEAIQALTESVAASSQAASVIEASSEQQIVGVDQVAIAISSIDEAIRSNVEAASQLEGAAARLKDLGESLKTVVERTKIR